MSKNDKNRSSREAKKPKQPKKDLSPAATRPGVAPSTSKAAPAGKKPG